MELVNQAKKAIDFAINYAKNNPVMAIIIVLMVWSIFFGNPFELFQDAWNEIAVGGDAPEGSEKGLGKSSVINLDTKDLEKLPPSQYEQERDVLDTTTEMQRTSGPSLWKQVIKPETAPKKKIAQIKAALEESKKTKTMSESDLQKIEAIKNIQTAEPDFVGIQSNIISQS